MVIETSEHAPAATTATPESAQRTKGSSGISSPSNDGRQSNAHAPYPSTTMRLRYARGARSPKHARLLTRRGAAATLPQHVPDSAQAATTPSIGVRNASSGAASASCRTASVRPAAMPKQPSPPAVASNPRPRRAHRERPRRAVASCSRIAPAAPTMLAPHTALDAMSGHGQACTSTARVGHPNSTVTSARYQRHAAHPSAHRHALAVQVPCCTGPSPPRARAPARAGLTQRCYRARQPPYTSSRHNRDAPSTNHHTPCCMQSQRPQALCAQRRDQQSS